MSQERTEREKFGSVYAYERWTGDMTADDPKYDPPDAAICLDCNKVLGAGDGQYLCRGCCPRIAEEIEVIESRNI
jgi:hypothetical protein